MQQDIASGAFVEHVSIHGNMYGTSLRALEDVNREGKIVLMDVDMHGVRSIKKAAEDPALDLRVKCLGIIPPSLEELEKRLRGRGTESEDQVQMRLKQAVVEAEFCKEDALVDATIVNYDSWSHAYPILRRLVTAQWFASRFSSTNQDV
ncbi:Guanylate kinase [Hondaea fermentalgiana]|uniref:Guanylate kinase n=1 Tax=Hondaea fermentalgiana TaxID=2315210 RepID=A0A2R5GEH4_9STRA|nr:Guanylate kinase [Hondaea fermentalgiana]|eukprot:GBG28709.1 Guanylate kinase [Hondaea fermentalgiana]